MTSAPERLLRTLLMAGVCLLAGCGANEVIVDGNYPRPLMERLPVTLGVVYTDAFATHEFFDEAAGRTESDWLVRTGEAQVEFWDIMFEGMFDEVIHLTDAESLARHRDEIDAVIIPYIDDLQYTIPLYTSVKVYEIWMRYRFQMVAADALTETEDGTVSYEPSDSFANFQLSAYGKTPTAFMQSNSEAVNLAAVVALRDAGANFATSFQRVPEVAGWLDELREDASAN